MVFTCSVVELSPSILVHRPPKKSRGCLASCALCIRDSRCHRSLLCCTGVEWCRSRRSVWLPSHRSDVELASDPLATVINSSREFFLVRASFCREMVCHGKLVVALTMAFLKYRCQTVRWHGGDQEVVLTAAVMGSIAYLRLMWGVVGAEKGVW